MRLLPSLLLATLLVSCSLQAKLTLTNGTLPVKASLQVSAAAKAAWTNLRQLDPTLPADPLSPELLQQGLGGQARVTTATSGTSLTFSIDPKKLFPGLKADETTWDVVLDRVAVRRLASLTSWADSPALDSLLPAPGTTVTEADYRDLLVYLLGPDTAEAAARVLVDSSSVQLTIVAPRPLKSADGAVSMQGNTALYRWPLVRVLTLATPLHLRLVF